MYRLYGFTTQNTMKVLYVLEELKTEYEFQFVNLLKGEQKEENFSKLNPVNKVPILQHNNQNLFESGAICRYITNVEASELYPKDNYQRALVDQWMDFFSCHLGRYLPGLVYEAIIVPKGKFREPSEDYIAEATQFIKKYFSITEEHLKNNQYFTGNQLTIADLFAFAYIEQVEILDIPLEGYPCVEKWFNDIKVRESIQRGKQRIK